MQDAKGPFSIGMFTKNMGFKASPPYYKMSKQKPVRLVFVQRPLQWAESCCDFPSTIQTAEGQMRIWDSHSLI